MNTPTADELMANPEWVAVQTEHYGELSPNYLRMLAEDQAARAADYFAALPA